MDAFLLACSVAIVALVLVIYGQALFDGARDDEEDCEWGDE